jgi:hypothetical protein
MVCGCVGVLAREFPELWRNVRPNVPESQEKDVISPPKTLKY